MKVVLLTSFAALVFSKTSSPAAVLYTSAGQIVSNASTTLPAGLFRTGSAMDSLYFRYTVNLPASNYTNEYYFAALQMFEGGTERLGVGNAWEFWAYSAFRTSSGNMDLQSSSPEAGQTHQLVRSSDITTFVYRVDYVNGGDDEVTVWLNPDFGQSEEAQPSSLTTYFTANATFDSLRLRHGNSNSWTFLNIVIADTPDSIGFVPEPATALLSGIGLLGFLRRRRTRRE